MTEPRVKPFGTPAAEPVPLDRVRLLDGPLKDREQLHRKVLLAWDADRLLHMFRVTAGLPSAAQPLGGWERPDCEIRGHSTGHYLSGLALMHASTGDAACRERAEYIVAELAKCQAAMPAQGYNPGYLFAFPESFFDRVDACQPVWVPWYTCHKIMAGLLDTYRHCGNRQALEVLLRMADWADRRTGRLSWAQMQRTLDLEFGGMEEVLADLYAVTGDPRHLALSRRFVHRKVFDPLAWGRDELTGLHANTQIPKFAGAARDYELTGDNYFRDVAGFAWEQVALHRSYCCGGHSHAEHFRTAPDVLASELGETTQETCNTYNMLKLTRTLLGWRMDPKYADFYERAFLNHILATQHPDTGMVMYFLSLRPGHWKVFGTANDSFWCCTGTAMESFSKLGDALYCRGADGLWVNQFFASEIDWREQGVRVRQETRFPEEPGTTLRIAAKAPAEWTLHVRIPEWAQGAGIEINGAAAEVAAEPSRYAALRRTWRDGDTVRVTLPMRLRLDRMPDNPAVAAVRYGPVVLAGALGVDGLTAEMSSAADQNRWNGAPGIAVPDFVDVPEALGQWIEPVPGQPLTFRTRGVGRPQDVTLIPLYKLYDQRYTVYWRLLSAAEAERAKK